MTIDGEYGASTTGWVRTQVETIEAAGDTRAVSLNGMAVVLMTMRGATSGKVRKVPVMRVEHDGVYAAVASRGGAPQNPAWYHNLVANPDVDLQDGTEPRRYRARIVTDPQERQVWWQRAVAAFPPYAEYQEKTDRLIPLFLLEPRP